MGFRDILGVIAFAGLLLLVACGDDQGPAAAVPTAEVLAPIVAAETGAGSAAPTPGEVLPTASPTPAPTPTPEEPVVALVNGQPIYESAFRQEVALFAASLFGGSETDTPEDAALAALIDRLLIEQAAVGLGISVTPEAVEAQLGELRAAAESSGGAGAFDAWLAANALSDALFRDLLRYELLTAAVAEQVTRDVPFAVEHVRARYLQVDDFALAQRLVAELAAGADFGTLAQLNSLDAVTAPAGGELGFFASGTLLIPEVEAAAFALQPGEVSDIITVSTPETGFTSYYLIQTLERDPARPLTADVRNTLLLSTYETWLAEQRVAADIEIRIDTGP